MSAKTAKRNVAARRRSREQACRICGCTDADCSDCIARTSRPCYWAAENLCSACAALPKPMLSWLARASEQVRHYALAMWFWHTRPSGRAVMDDPMSIQIGRIMHNAVKRRLILIARHERVVWFG